MKGIVIYRGRYGSTGQYADWLGKDLHIPVMEADEISVEKLDLYDYIIVGGSVYIGKLLVRDWIRKYETFLRSKAVYFFIVCATPAEEKEKIDEIIKNNLPESLRTGDNVFLLPGRMIKKNLSKFDLFTLRMGAFLEKNKVTRKQMLLDFDSVKRSNLEPLVKAVRVGCVAY
ncbi:MAG TPA: flavodoxin domain-containing protein [Chitinophagaceae bacterium]